MNEEVLKLSEAVREAGGRAMLVGGWVRDKLFGIESKDFDLEVYGLDPARLRALLESLGAVNTVGQHFSVYKLILRDSNQTGSEERFEIDVSIPRRESKSGRGHRGFTITGDPEMTFEEAARRRDFTINAILYDPLTNEFVDPFRGREDLKHRVLRAVAAETFVEDSLRVLRAVQLAARFEMKIDPPTAELCRAVDLSDLPHERIWGEVEKLLTLAERPSIGLGTALELGVLERLFPEIHSLAGSQRLDHTKLCLDEAVKLSGDLTKARRVTVRLAALCHDLGGVVSPDRQAEADTQSALSVMRRLGLHRLAGYDVRSQVLALVREHRTPEQLYRNRDHISDGAIRRLALRVEIGLLYRLAKACALSRGSEVSAAAPGWLIEKARALGVEHGPPAPLVQGRDLIGAGFEPGPRMGEILRHVYELQLDGEVNSIEDALAAARRFG
jgi:tRNA nucleotidyltransferase (CCA-adding enzyme)